MTQAQIHKTIAQRNQFLKSPYPTCSQCEGTQVVFSQNWNRRINKQRELYQIQHFPEQMQKICQCEKQQH